MHDNAFGCSIKNSNLFNFHLYANEKLKNVDFGVNIYDVDFIRNANEKDLDKIIYDLSHYENIWGQLNPQPLLLINNIYIKSNDIQIIGKNKDTLKFEKNGIAYIKFHAKNIMPLLEQYDDMAINIIGKTNLNEWNGQQKPQIFIEDLEVFDNTYGF